MAGSSGWRMSRRWRGARSPWNHGQHDMRRVTLVMEDRLPGRLPPRAGGLVLARVQVAVEAREIAGGDLEADAMAGQEDVAGGPEVDGEARHLARDEGRGGRARLAVAGAHDAVRQVLGIAVGAHVHELRGEVGVGRVARRVERYRDGPGDLEP